MINNPWRYCNREKPPEYVRIQIRDKNYIKYVGYRCKNTYYETIGNYVIHNPYQWRYIPVGSYLWDEIKEKIHTISYGTVGEVAYDNSIGGKNVNCYF